LKWLQAASDCGFALAECYLALWYKDHPGRDVDLQIALARSLLESAERKGLLLAKKMLDKMVPASAPAAATVAPMDLSLDREKSAKKPAQEQDPLVPHLQKHLQDKEKQLALLKDQEVLLDRETMQIQMMLGSLRIL